MMAQNQTLENYFCDYSSYHRTEGNQLTHLLGIPLIVIAVLSWLSRVWIIRPDDWLTAGMPLSLIRWDLGVATVIVASAWYVYLNWRLGGPFALVLYGLYWLGRPLPQLAVWAFFVGGWILQFIGHAAYEKKSPAFFKNVEHLLIGPIWVFSKLITGNVSPGPGDSGEASGNGAKK